MSEQSSHQPEHTQSAEKHEHHAEHQELHHQHEKPAEQPEKRPDDIENIRAAIKQHTEHQNHHVEHTHHDETTSPFAINREFKNQALYRTLKNIRRRLSPSDRTLSRILHQPVVDAASDVGGKTIARPSGILGGGICAFAGSLFLYFAKHDGFRYNYLLFLVFFVGGFAIGLLFEVLVWVAYSRRQP